MMKSLVLAAASVIASVGLCSSAQAGTIRDDRADSLYTNLAATSPYAPTGFVLGTSGGSGFIGSGTLISSEWVLTAAHIVEGTDRAGGGISNLRFGLGANANGGTVSAAQWIPHPNWTATNGSLTAGWDVGLIRLSSPITTVAPALRYFSTDEKTRVGTHVGYGATGTGLTGINSGAGTKRAGDNVIDAFGGDTVTTGTGGGLSFSNFSSRIMFDDFDNPNSAADSAMGSTTPVNLEYMIAGGDSGGGAFINVGGVNYLAGVHSFISSIDGNTNADYGDISGSIRVSQFNDWINSQIPEPGSLAFLLIPAAMLRRRR